MPFSTEYRHVESLEGSSGTLDIILTCQLILENIQWFRATENFVNFDYSIQISIESLFSFSSLNLPQQVLIGAELI